MGMNTRSDITPDERIDITVAVTAVDEWDHQTVARKVILTDVDGNRIPLTIFNDNDCADFDWQVGQWYRLEQATGDVYQGDKQLKPSWDFAIDPLDAAPDGASEQVVAQLSEPTNTRPGANSDASSNGRSGDSTGTSTGETSADGGAAMAQPPLDRGNYLLHFPLGELSDLEVHEYQLAVPGGIDEQDEPLDNGILGFTARAAARYRYRSGAPVTTNGPLTVYAVEKLRDTLDIDGYTVDPTHVGTTTLDARSYDDQAPLRELVKQDVKAALQGRYIVNAINSIIEFTPHVTAESGEFTASREYKCRIWVDPDGTVICGLNIAHHLSSTFSAADYVRRGYEIEGVAVEHNTDLYDQPGTGTVTALADVGYTEFVPEMGASTAEYHLERGYVDDATVESVRAGDPVMARVDYGDWEGLQALEYCTVVPTLDQLKRVDEAFHERFQTTARLRPDERFAIARTFIDTLGPTPALGLDSDGQPSNACYEECSVETDQANMRFNGGRTASYGAAGLDRYGVYETPTSFDLLALYPLDDEAASQAFIRGLLEQLHDYQANPTALDQEAYQLGSEFGYTQAAQHAEEFDGVVAVVPDPEWLSRNPSIDDPYPEFKRQFGQEQIPSQMVRRSSLTKDAYLGNIAAGIVAKCGGIPWRVHEVPGDTDVFIGLDVTLDHASGQHIGASANVVLADGTILASQSVSIQQGETFQVDDIVDIIKNLLTVYLKTENGTPTHVVIHRDGQFYLDIDALVERLEMAEDLIPRFDLVELRKSGNPRIADYTGEQFDVAPKGTAFEAVNADHAYLATTGSPERVPGTPRPIRVVKRRGPTELATLTAQAYWLSEAHVGSINRSTRLPITTYYADRCAEHARKGYLLSGELIKGVPYV